jgi:7-cyano-7-deazaguanine synthase in queuosine biosynthesis
MRAIVLLSGGLDSAVSLHWAKSKGWRVFPIEFDYYDRPERERQACSDLCAQAGIRGRIVVPVPFMREAVDIPDLELANPALRRAPEGYIPVRNLAFYSLAAYYAETLGARYIVGGHNRTDRPAHYHPAGRRGHTRRDAPARGRDRRAATDCGRPARAARPATPGRSVQAYWRCPRCGPHRAA